MSTPIRFDPVYVAARRVLLDALVQLAPHGPAVVVAGAQAIYLRTGTADLAIAPYTTDGDLAIDPALLGEAPRLAQAMTAAGLRRSLEPGIWHAAAAVDDLDVTIPVDLIVPEQAAPAGGRRAARLDGHGDRTARRACGLEAALVDRSPMVIAALDPADPRTVEAEVAGEAALLVAKVHKVHDRVRSRKPARIDDKDAADVVRLMRMTSPATVGETLAGLRDDPIAGAAAREGVRLLELLFGRAERPGVQMATRALRRVLAESLVAGLCVAYTRELVRVAG